MSNEAMDVDFSSMSNEQIDKWLADCPENSLDAIIRQLETVRVVTRNNAEISERDALNVIANVTDRLIAMYREGTLILEQAEVSR